MSLTVKAGHTELEECAQKARVLKASRLAKSKRGRRLSRTESAKKLVEDSFSLFVDAKPVWLAALSFFIAGAFDDAVVYAFPPEALGRTRHGVLLFADAILVHVYCALVCAFLEEQAVLEKPERQLLKSPMIVLCGWMWKSALVYLAGEVVDNVSSDVTAVEMGIWVGFAIVISVLAVFYTAAVRRLPPIEAGESYASGFGKTVVGLSADSLVLPVAAIWDEALVYHTESLTPDAALRTTPAHQVYLIKAFLVHLCICTTGQCYRNYRRATKPPPATPKEEVLAANRAIFEDKTFMFVVAWGWWNVPEILYGARGLSRNDRSITLAMIVVVYAGLAVYKTYLKVRKPGATPYKRPDLVFVTLTAAAIDPQLGWAIKATRARGAAPRAPSAAKRRVTPAPRVLGTPSASWTTSRGGRTASSSSGASSC